MPSKVGDERRSIEELVTRYLLEPELADIYVEGPSDAALISWFLKQHHRGYWRVYPIDSVDVPSVLVNARGFDVGARGRVLTLRLALEDQLPHDQATKLLFIADRDLDIILGNDMQSSRFSLFTDFTSMELYSYNARTLQKFLELVIRTRKVNAEEVLAAIDPVLIDLFLLRAAFFRTSRDIGLVNNVTNCCSRKQGVAQIDLEELTRYCPTTRYQAMAISGASRRR